MKFILTLGTLLLTSSIASAIEEVSIADVAPPYIGDGLELAITPRPQEAKLSETMLVVPGIKIETAPEYANPYTAKVAAKLFESSRALTDAATKLYLGEFGDGGPADKILQALKLVPDADKRKLMGEQGYVLYVGQASETKNGVIVVSGVGPAGTYYALQSLRQLTVIREGKVYVRMGRVVDGPAMPWRGSKRPTVWEERYKANYGAVQTPVGEEHFRVYPAGEADPQRQPKSWELDTDARRSASRGLDCSDRMIDHIMKSWTEAYHASGQRHFTLKGDDIELSLDEKSGTKSRFKDSYGAAFVYLLTELNRRLKGLDSTCTLYWMPNPYYIVNWDFERLSRQVREAGGLPSDVGLWWTGHFVFSPIMTADDISGYQRAFYGDNPTKVRGLIYDNHGRAEDFGGRADDFFAMPQRDPEISKYLMGLSNERGSAINRITSYDFQWNAHGYDAERSLKLAVRELTARDPDYYRLVLQFVRAWEEGRYPSPKFDTHEAIEKQQRALIGQLTTLGEQLERVGGRVLKNVEGNDYRRWFLNRILASLKMKQSQMEFLLHLWRDAAAPAYLIDANEAPTIDGQLDEACYRRAPTLDRFVTEGTKMVDNSKANDDPKSVMWEIPFGTISPELSTQGWIFSDGEHLYLAFRCRDELYARPPGQSARQPIEREKVGNDHPYCWRQPCLDINLDVQHDHQNTFHMIVDPLGQVYDEYLGWPGDPLPTGPPWSMGNDFKVRRDGDSWTLEAAIKLDKFGLKGIKPGDVWGANVYRSGLNAVSLFCLLKDTGPYGLRYPKMFGHVRWK